MDSSYGAILDNIISKLGQFGRFNLVIFVLLFLPVYFTGMYGTNYVFLAADVDYRCRIPGCDPTNTSEYSTPWSQYSRPVIGRDSKCSYYPLIDNITVVENECSGEGIFDVSRKIACNEWVYASDNTIVKEFDLACKDWMRTMVGTVHNFGMLVSMPIIGIISDRYGRKTALIISSTLVSVFGLLKSFALSYEIYVACEFMETVAGASVYPSAFVMMIELLGQDNRVIVSLILGAALAFGSASLALLDLAVGYWRTWARIAYTPSILFALYIFILPESIRWLIAKGNTEKAIKIIHSTAKFNNVSVPYDSLNKLRLARDTADEINTDATSKQYSLFEELFKSPLILKRLLICATWWITALFVFYGLAVHANTLAGSKHWNYVLLSCMEIIGITINTVTLDRVGRKPVLMTAFFVCGVSCIGLPFVPLEYAWMKTTAYLIGKIAITMALNGLYMYTSELFPTNARHSLLAFCSMTGRIGSMVAPQMPLLAIYMESLPSLLFGFFPIVCGLMMITMPETLHTVLPDTFSEAEQITKRNPKRKLIEL